MVVPFDAAWSVLKALPEQQIPTTGRKPETMPKNRNFAEMLANPSRYESRHTGRGTMHPAIQGLLARRGASEEPSFRYVGHPLFDRNMVDTSVPAPPRSWAADDPRAQKLRGSAVDRSSQGELNSRMAVNNEYSRYQDYDLGGFVTNDPRVHESHDRSLGRRVYWLG
jgi:hypothetical protein